MPSVADGKSRCAWAAGSEAMIAYHDLEWGRPVHDDHVLFEFLVLEGAQAGLSWSTILGKRAGYRRAFAGFDPRKVARFGDAKVAALVGDATIVRHRGKIESTISNAKAFLDVQEQHGSFDAYVWAFVGGAPIRRRPATIAQVPASSPESDALSRDLKKRGFRFVGSTIVYAFMQACGLVDDHVAGCFLSARPAGRK